MQEIQAIFFDMDGVLVFSEPFWREAEHKVFKKHFNIELTEDDVNQSTGLKTTEVVNMHMSKYGFTCDLEEIGYEIEKEVVRLVYERGEPMKDLIELTEWIKEKSWRRCLVTSSSKYVYENIVRFVGLDGFFERKFTAYDEEWGKPNPAVYHSAVNYLDLPKESIIVIEDSMNGVKAAHAAGLKILGLPEEHNKTNELYNSMVTKSFNSHFEILNYLKSNC
ncbi:MAG: HAD family hydrolase [Chitinophagales bacterium]|jgi:HAD superfamily hydrolase (TIGR01509 family)|nr:HAD family phosphatase [Sphingobacteriales bacterium]